MSLKTKVARKAAKGTVKHTARGAASKLRRDPARFSTVFVLGCVVGVLVGWIAAGRSGPPPDARPG
jgi:F0F1-type ATP synthase assembly protein I